MIAASPLRELAVLCARRARPTHDGFSPKSSIDALCVTAQAHEMAGSFALAALEGRAGPLDVHWDQGLTLYLERARIEARDAETQLAALLGLFAQRHLVAIPFKGPVLARSAYTDVGARACRDLDVLVRPEDVDAVLACLVDAGFVHQHGIDADGIAALRCYGGEYILFRTGGLPVEPHWHPAPHTLAFDIDIDAIWTDSVTAEVQGMPCRMLTPSDHLLLLALHGAKEQWHKLKWIADIDALLAATPTLDVTALRIRASAQGCRRIVDLALALSHRLFGTPIGTDVDAITWRLADRVIARLEASATPPNGPYRLDSFYWQLRERRRDRWRYAIRTIFTPRVAHYQALPLPDALKWALVPLKPFWDYLLTPGLRLVRTLRRRAI